MIKIGYYNFWNECLPVLTNILLHSVKEYIMVDCCKETADIVFTSVAIENPNRTIQGSPIIIYWTGENEGIFSSNIPYDYSISHKIDSDINLYVPYWQIRYLDNIYNNTPYTFKRENVKSKFCTFISSNPSCGNLAIQRMIMCKQLSMYKKIDCVGPCLNNTGFLLSKNMNDAKEFHKSYKFNLCWENSTNPSQDVNYITEKIFNAFEYNTIPIYAGSDKITELINPKAFINCNGKTITDVIEEIKYYDRNNNEYNKMLHEPLFATEELNNRDWEKYIHNQIDTFIQMIIKKHF